VAWLVVIGLIAAGAIGFALGRGGDPPAPSTSASALAPAPVAAPAVPLPKTAVIAAAGDVLIHEPIINAASLGGAQYDFAPMFAPIAPYLGDADYTIANLEVRLAGQARGYSGYPQFNSPAVLADAIKGAGVAMVATANNHSMDKGWDGVTNTLDNVERAGLAHIGTARTQEERDTPTVVDINGIAVGLLNYTFGTNGIPLPKGKAYAVNISSAPRIIAEAAAVRQAGAAFVIAVLHWGSEYERAVNAQNRELAKTLLAGGVDAILATHPHVVQPIEKLTVKRAGQPYTGVVVHSTGNFLANQRQRYRDSGIIAYLTLEQAEGAAPRVTAVRYLPVYVQVGPLKGRTAYRVLPAHPRIAPETDVPLDAAATARLAQVWQELTEHLDRPKDGIAAYQPEP
jgi:poly-gamma-glutamate synthesis protein (capsule biosynthesis protein)